MGATAHDICVLYSLMFIVRPHVMNPRSQEQTLYIFLKVQLSYSKEGSLLSNNS